MSFWVAGAIVVGSAVSAASASSAAGKAAQASQSATDAATSESRRQYDQTRADYLPFMQTGYVANADINKLYGRTTAPDGTVTGGGPADFSGFFKSPDYQFNLAEGQKAIDRSASARGGLLSGGAVKAGINYASGLASREYTDYYNRLAGQAGMGQTATGTVTQAGANASNNISGALIANGQARGNAYVMGAQGVNNAVQGGVSNYLLSKYLKAG